MGVSLRVVENDVRESKRRFRDRWKAASVGSLRALCAASVRDGERGGFTSWSNYDFATIYYRVRASGEAVASRLSSSIASEPAHDLLVDWRVLLRGEVTLALSPENIADSYSTPSSDEDTPTDYTRIEIELNDPMFAAGGD